MPSTTTLDPRGATRAIAFAMRSLEERFDISSANLSNLETSGHKRVFARAEGFSAELQRAKAGGGGHLLRDYSQGDLIADQDPSELALKGEGFFAVEQGDQVRYTRWVRVHSDADGTLLDQNDGRLLGEGGPLRGGGPSSKFQVERDGTVKAEGQDQPVGRVRVVAFVDPQQLEAVPGGYYKAPDGAEIVGAKSTDVVQGSRERSNTDSMHELVELITIHRQYEAATRALQVESELRQRLNQGLR